METKQSQTPAVGGSDAVDRATFERVWNRVMPEQQNSPIALGGAEEAEYGPDWMGSGVPAVQPRQEPSPLVCLGEESAVYDRQLREVMQGVWRDWQAYRALAQRASGSAARVLNPMACQQREALRRLSAAYFLIMGEHSQPGGAIEPRTSPLAAALREQFMREQRWQLFYQAAAAENRDPCLKSLYLDLEHMAQDHADQIRRLLEQMQPLPGCP